LPNAKFKNPPIVEAVVGFRFLAAEEWTAEVQGAMEQALRAIYTGESQQERKIQVHFRADAESENAEAKSAPGRLLLREDDGSALVGLGPSSLSVHVLAPYPGWEDYQRRIRQAMDVAISHIEVAGLLEVAVRYIDRISLPPGEVADLSSYFTSLPVRPPSMPATMTAYQFITETFDPETRTSAALTTAAVPPRDGESFAMLYDLNLMRRYSPDAPLEPGEYMDVVNALHDRQYSIFMESVAERTKELFA